MDVKKNLGQNVKFLRKQRGISQNQLAQLSGIPRSTLAHIELEEANPSLTTLSLLANSLAVPIEELIATPKVSAQLFKRNQLPCKKYRGGVEILELLPQKLASSCFERMHFQAFAHKKGTPHTLGTKEFFFLEKGKVSIFVAGKQFDLSEGDVLSFKGSQPHSYKNEGEKEALAFSVVIFS